MRTLILAGGEGRRLKSVAGDLPKCLVPVQDRPFIEHQIELLRSKGITDLVLCVGLGADAVREALGDGSALGVTVRYSSEDSPLGTAGAVKNAEGFVEAEFLCMNGDTLVEFSLEEMEGIHQAGGAIATILSREVEDATGRGTLEVGSHGEILSFSEKRKGRTSAFINCGVYLMQKEILNHIPSGRAVSLEREVFPVLVSSGARLMAFKTHGDFVDIGTPGEYLRIREKGWKR
ncbi:MAG: NTP transferase domain-containing protein [Candidatus Eiseniibacteriota bacterium]|nr:MAG: NTP transferase domain-containing protein [Candidatus Eisenbacteria bacterium]